MTRVLRLTVLTGPHKGTKFCLRPTAHCVAGRGSDCFVRLAGTMRDQCISRHHCEVSMQPSRLTLKDLGSSNGTYLNGTRIDSLDVPLAGDSDEVSPTLSRHDLLTIGGTTLRLDLVVCPPEDTATLELRPGDAVGAAYVVWQEGETAKKDCPIRCT